MHGLENISGLAQPQPTATAKPTRRMVVEGYTSSEADSPAADAPDTDSPAAANAEPEDPGADSPAAAANAEPDDPGTGSPAAGQVRCHQP